MKRFSIQNPFVVRRKLSFSEELCLYDGKVIGERQFLESNQQCVERVPSNELVHKQHSTQSRASKKQVRNLFKVVNHVEQNYGSLLDEFPGDESQLAKILTLKASHPEQVASAAIKMGVGVEFIAMFHESMMFELTSECWEAAILVDDAASMAYLAENDVPMDLAQVGMAAAFKRGEHIDWLGHMIPRVAINAAVASGDVAAVRVLHETCKIPYNYKTMRHAAKHGHPRLIRHLHETGCPWEAKVAAIFAHNNRLDCLTYASQTGCPLEVSTCHAAASQGHLVCLEYAHQQGCPWDASVCAAAAKAGHLHCLEYAHLQGCPWDASTCRAAALQGHLACLEFAHSAGCPWDETICAAAAVNGHLQCLQYAHKNGCPWDQSTMLKAMVGNHRVCLHYAHQNDCPGAFGLLLQTRDREFLWFVLETWFARNTTAVYRVLAITTALSLLDKCFYKYLCVHWGVIIAQVMFMYDCALVLQKPHKTDRSLSLAALVVLLLALLHIVSQHLLYAVLSLLSCTLLIMCVT